MAAVGSVGGRAVRDKLIESTLEDVFPQLDDLAVRSIARVISLSIDDKLNIKNFGVETAKGEIIEALKKENPELATSAEVVDFIYKVNEAKSKK